MPALEQDERNAAPIWIPAAASLEQSAMSRFRSAMALRHGLSLPDYASLHRWSIERPEAFWSGVWNFCGIVGEQGGRVLAQAEEMPGAQWFPEARLNFAHNLLRQNDDSDAIVFSGEAQVRQRLTHAQLYREVASFAAALRAHGVVAGDRVAAFMPNIPQTVVAMLAAASIGAIFSSASPDFGVQGVLDRFGQIAPKVLVAADGARWGGKLIDSMSRIASVAAGLPGLQTVVIVSYIHDGHDLSGIVRACMWDDFVAPHRELTEIEFAELPFNHPLYVLYSSGTTGMPKCIVHGAGGTLIQHLKEHRLHCDLRAGDRLFYYTTCGWMMWNWLVSGLASGATLMLYDGSPFADDGRALWDFCHEESFTHFGTSAKYLDSAAKSGLKPASWYDMPALRVVMSTGSPLMAEGFDYVYRDIKRDVCLASISGGTDIVSCFVLGNPAAPVWRGEIQCKGLGMAVEVFDAAGRPTVGARGELVCTQAFPSMPLCFWNDADGSRYRAAYFQRFPGVWCHGDWCEETAHGGFVIYGRSDATLNPGGVRIGTAEIYRQVEKLPEILESIVIGQDWDNDVRTVLFVRLQDGLQLDEALVARIRQGIRDNVSPRHVPARILQVTDIPRTRSGKLVELAVRAAVHGQEVRNIEAMLNPQALDQFRNRPELMH